MTHGSLAGDAGSEREERTPPPVFRDVLEAYEDFLLHQAAAGSALVRWTRSSRSLDFAWLSEGITAEEIVLEGRQTVIARDSPLFESVRRMHTTVSLNPYEREVLYGYPFVIGRRDGKSIRGPLLTLPVQLVSHGDGFAIVGDEEAMRFNALPFKIGRTDNLDLVLSNLTERAPAWPTDLETLQSFVREVYRELSGVEVGESLDGTLGPAPSEPTTGEFVRIVPQAAVFVAPRSNYFLASDLEAMQEAEKTSASLLALLTGAGAETPIEVSDDQLDGSKLIFPFASNRSQRRVALLLDDPTTSVVRVEGPPGTGKSLTIANLACHLAATGRSVLVTSQKDKALQVVDQKLRELQVPGFPITLLRHDKDAKRELLDRLSDAGKKTRGSTEVAEELGDHRTRVEEVSKSYVEDSRQFDRSVAWEEQIQKAAEEAAQSGGVRGFLRRRGLRKTLRRAEREAPRWSDEIALSAMAAQDELLWLGRAALITSAELGVAEASRGQRQHLKELEALLRRNQKSARNYHLFDRLKQDPERAKTLLRLLPVWIMAPDDVARLFPGESGLFDVVIVDEASQVDLPSIFPVLHRAKKLVVSGDTKQMQPRRFAFAPQSLAAQAWQRVRKNPDPVVDLLDPADKSLLDLAFVRAQEENLLDEHFRSLPAIIDFSNNRWYRGKLRIMTDERRKHFGSPTQPVMQLHRVEAGSVTEGTQENLEEAKALVAFLAGLIKDPDYDGASIGVLGLFADQVELLQQTVADTIEDAEWEEHDIVVVNPDGFQGDERDVILYSLSYDGRNMPRAAISARQQDSPHVQGMLNVAVTRARDEVHVFHSAPAEEFFKEDATGAIGDWLAHIQDVQDRPRDPKVGTRRGRIDSQFEADVADELRKRGVSVSHQYQACGYFIDLMCELNDVRVGVECDGPTHFDEHGRRRLEDLERLSVLRRAGWQVVNIPYRQWLRFPGEAIENVLSALEGRLDPDELESDTDHTEAVTQSRGVSAEKHAVFLATKDGLSIDDDVFRRARDVLGRRRLTHQLRDELRKAAVELSTDGLLVVEDGEFFLTPVGRETQTVAVSPPRPTTGRRSAGRRQKASRARNASRSKCSCGGSWVLRTGRHGKFYGCSRYPRCKRTRNYP